LLHRSLADVLCQFALELLEGWFANLVLTVVGARGKLAASRSWYFLRKDRAALSRSIERVLALPFATLVMAHGEIVHEAPRECLAKAVRWLLPHRVALPAIT
jgi:hypothetical protein